MPSSKKETEVGRLAARQLADYDARSPGMMFAYGLTLSEAEAYAVQARMFKLREERGEHLIGYKMGCTSTVIQQQLGIDHPVYGRLTGNECHAAGSNVSLSNYCNLAIEGEFAVRLNNRISDQCETDDEFKQAIGAVFPVIELHNFVFRGSSPSAAELIANNAMHAGLVLPTVFPQFRGVAETDLTICVNDRIEDSWTGAELAEDVVFSLRWLSSQLRQQGVPLEAGQIILTGTRAKLTLIQSPSRVVVETSRFGAVSVEITV